MRSVRTANFQTEPRPRFCPFVTSSTGMWLCSRLFWQLSPVDTAQIVNTASRIAQCSPRPATGTCCILSYRHWMHIPSADACLFYSSTGIIAFLRSEPRAGEAGGPSLPAPLVLGRLSSGRPVRAPDRRGWSLPIICVGRAVFTYTQNWQLFV